jgi:hypothetical protein
MEDAKIPHWKAHELDDEPYFTAKLSMRQEFIRSCLRFLSYSIIRTDPNQPSVNQNFVAHSRKILDSGLFQDVIKDKVFKANNVDPTNGKVSKAYEIVIDPVYLNCIQLFTYIINDLPQKLVDFICKPKEAKLSDAGSDRNIDASTKEELPGEIDEDAFVPVIIQSLIRRVPPHVDMFQIVTKFFKMLNLSPLGVKLLLETPVLSNFFSLALDPKY